MDKRGRPTMNGAQTLTRFARSIRVLHAYDEARSSGLKHSSAVTEAVATMKKANPDMPISESEVRRVLAEHRPKGSSVGLKVTKGPESEMPLSPANEKLGIPVGSKWTPYVFGVAPRVDYPRINARSPASKK